ncbi:GTPase-activating protein [Venturia nashicola]|uniref:GTPase-activating protein n=1 Tax=Venturia nashicola TaxID=86259 RepID=A0A4Z1P672_9PEZI|nr:GTPase-activating protein [Venturia nashicola]
MICFGRLDNLGLWLLFLNEWQNILARRLRLPRQPVDHPCMAWNASSNTRMLHPDGVAVYIESLSKGKALVEYVKTGYQNLPGAEAMECYINVSDNEPYAIIVDFKTKLLRARVDGTKLPDMKIHRWIDEEGVGQNYIIKKRVFKTHHSIRFRGRNHTAGRYTFANLQKADAKYSPEFGKIVVQVQPVVSKPIALQDPTSQAATPTNASPMRFVFRYRSTEYLQKLEVVLSNDRIGNEKAPTSRPDRQVASQPVAPQGPDMKSARRKKEKQRQRQRKRAIESTKLSTTQSGTAQLGYCGEVSWPNLHIKNTKLPILLTFLHVKSIPLHF